MSDNPETQIAKNFTSGRWEWLAKQPAGVETAAANLPLVGERITDKIRTVITSRQDPLFGMSENAKNAQENSGNWGAQAVIDKEQARISENLKSADPQIREEAASEGLQLRTAVREGGDTLKNYVESREDQIESTFDQAREKAENQPRENTGQTAAVDLIVEEAESVKHDLADETTPDKAGKLQRLAEMALMLEGVAGDSHKGLRRLKIWLGEKAAEITANLAAKQPEETGIISQLATLETPSPAPETPVAPPASPTSPESPAPPAEPAAPADQSTADIHPELAPASVLPESPPLPNPSPDASATTVAAIKSALAGLDESLLPATSASPELIEKTRDLIRFRKLQAEMQAKVNLAQSWASAKSP